MTRPGSHRGAQPDPVRRPAPGVQALKEGTLFGHGSPEGVEYAGTGVIYRDTDPAGTGKVYKKTTPTGNTGWVELIDASGAGGGTPPYAIQVKKHSGSLSIPSASDTNIQFDLETPYFEIVNGTMWPPDYPGGSMFDKDDGYRIYTPVEGLWGFRANYRYSGLPQGKYAYTIVRRNGSTPVAIEAVPTSAVPTGAGTPASVVGTAYQTATDYLGLFLRQESGAGQTVQMGGAKDDIPTDGIVFSVWLIAERT